MKRTKRAIFLIVLFMINVMVKPDIAHATEIINRDNLQIEKIQEYLRINEPEFANGWNSYYLWKDKVIVEINILGDMTLIVNDEEYEYGNIHLPKEKMSQECVQTSSGSICVEGKYLTRYFYGEPIYQQKLSEEISEVQEIIKLPEYKSYIVLADKNVYTIDQDGKVYTLWDESDVKVVALTNYLNIEDTQISIITNQKDWYYTIEPFVGKWTFVDEGIECFQCDEVVKK